MQLANAHVYRGIACVELNRHAEALAQFEHASILDPAQSWPHRLRAIVLARQGKLPEALEAANKATDVEPCDAEAHATRGYGLFTQTRALGESPGRPSLPRRLLGRDGWLRPGPRRGPAR
jgi:Flp pilus assembly protein TadD